MIKLWPLLLLVAAFLAGVNSVRPSCAAVSAPVTSPHDRATLVTDLDAVGPGQTVKAALRLELQPHWHTYWKNPGDAGEATTLSVTSAAPRAGKADQIAWPTPSRIIESGLMAYGYEGDVVLPVTLHTAGAGGLKLHAHAEWLVCANTCVPEGGDFTIALPPSSEAAPKGHEAGVFHDTEGKTPRPAPFSAVFDQTGLLRLSGELPKIGSVNEAWFIPDTPGVIDQMMTQPFSKTDDGLSLQLKWSHSQAVPTRLGGVIVFDGAAGKSAYDVSATRSDNGFKTAKEKAAHGQEASLPEQNLSFASTLKVLVFAFIAGLILNLMPCVFPVLAMKALSLIRLTQASRRSQVRSAFFYALGVIGTFLLLAAVMLALRAAGTQIGWGFQFQSPLFVIMTIWLLLLLALNLFGVFEITLAAIDGVAMTRTGIGGDLMTGVLAVVVATPCTAPFMGTALAVALTSSIWTGALIFLSMGAGLSSPYVLIACFPALGRLLPRPGGWMLVLKQLLAFPLLASCVWLLWVVTLQGGALLVLVASAGMVALGMAAWLFGLAQRQKMRGTSWWPHVNRAISGMILIGVVLSAVWAVQCLRGAATLSAAAQKEATSSDHLVWSPEKLAELRAQHRPVLVDMTAAWCITCLINERGVLSTKTVRNALETRNVSVLVGDWTNKDDHITAYLRAHHRDGVPLYVYYAPGQEGVILPQLLTTSIILKAINGTASMR